MNPTDLGDVVPGDWLQHLIQFRDLPPIQEHAVRVKTDALFSEGLAV